MTISASFLIGKCYHVGRSFYAIKRGRRRRAASN